MTLAWAGSVGSANVQVNPLSGSVTVAAGTKTVYIGVMARNSQTASTPTYNGVACTEIVRYVVGAGETTVWKLDDPATGANTLSVPFSGACYCAAAVIESDEYVSHGTPVTATGPTTTPAVTVPSAVGSIVLAFIHRASFIGACTWQSPATELDPAGTPGGDSTGGRGLLASGQEAGAASVTIDAVLGVSDTWGMIGLSLTEAGGQGPLIAGGRNSLLA